MLNADEFNVFRYHYLVLSFMQEDETELELDLTDEELKVGLNIWYIIELKHDYEIRPYF